MNLTLTHITLIGAIYLATLFGIAYATNRHWIPERITNHPATYILSLGIFFSAWTFYGVIDLANQFGYGVFAYYLGISAFFIFAPTIQAPLAELCKRFQLRSIADLLVFRYSSQMAGSLATFCMLLAILPLMVLQIQSITDTLQILTNSTSNITNSPQQKNINAFLYCLVMASFCMTFGAGYRQYRSLMTTMAFESVIKILALFTIGLFAIYGVFGGFGGLDQWLSENPDVLEKLHAPPQSGSPHTLLLVFLSTSIFLPYVFHMTHVDVGIKQMTRILTWAFPAMLFMVALPVFPILWAGFKLDVFYPASYFVLGVPMFSGSGLFTIIAYIGGVSAASGALIVAVLSLSTMIANHWVLPLLALKKEGDLYAQLRWLRRTLIFSIILLAYIIYLVIDYRYSLLDLGLITFIQALQFLPGVLAINYITSANRYGFYAGIIVGTFICAASFIIPVISGTTTLTLFSGVTLEVGINAWENITLFSIACNISAFVIVSYFTTMTDEERYHAELCAEDELSHPFRRSLDISTAEQFISRLKESIGERAATREVHRALDYFGFTEDESRPYALRRLRTRIRANLSALLGQSVATELMDKHFPYHAPSDGEVLDINLMENRLDRLGDDIHGITADVNQLRLYHRNTLQELPIAICSLGLDDEILLWNHAMSDLAHVDSETITGSNIKDVPEPWGQLIEQFANSSSTHTTEQTTDKDNNQHWYRLHKSAPDTTDNRPEGRVILIEDVTELQLLQQELMHNTRLASIGRLAAGVAHEIGNPVTGIACLAQNLRYEEDEEGREETAKAILSQTDRISRIVQSLVTFAHTGKSSQKDFHKVSAQQCIDEAIHLLSLQKDRKPIEYVNLVTPNINVWGDSQRLIQVFINLLSNANDASPNYSSITIKSDIKTPFVNIHVIDEGDGIPQENIDQIMEPFFTTKDAGKGTGLGLAVVFSVIEEHQGHTDIISPVAGQRGTCVTIKLPLYSESLESVSMPVQASSLNNVENS